MRTEDDRITDLATALSGVVNQGPEERGLMPVVRSLKSFSVSSVLFLTMAKLSLITLSGWHRSNRFLQVPCRDLLALEYNLC